MSGDALREAICEAGRRLYARNLVAATDGNISVRLDADRYLCTPSGVCKGGMTPDSLVIADGAGRLIEGSGRVSSEFFTHLAVYEERPDFAAVVHAHPPHATALTLAGIGMMRPVLPELVMALGSVPTCPYATPGSKEGGDAVRAWIRRCDAVLLDRHGAITAGAHVWDAYFKMEKLEHAAQMLAAAHALATPPLLGTAQIQRILEARAAYGAKGRIFVEGNHNA